MPNHYQLVFEKSSTGYAAYSPDIPGCIAAAGTLAETEKLMREAIHFHLSALRAEGYPIPQPSTIIKRVSAKDFAPLTS